jgi:hypothetical protein
MQIKRPRFLRRSGLNQSNAPQWPDASSSTSGKSINSTGDFQSFGGASTWLSGITLIITIMSITLYAAGKAYRVNYLHQFGVADVVIPWTPQDLIYLGAVTQLEVLIFALPVLALVLLSLAFIMWASYGLGRIAQRSIQKTDFSKVVRKILQKQKNNDPNAPITETAFLFLLTTILIIFFFLVIACLIFIANAEQLGEQQAAEDKLALIHNDLKKIKSRNLTPVSLGRKLDGLLIKDEGHVISCSEKRCLLYQIQANTKGNQKAITKVKIVPIENVANFSFNLDLQE